MSSVKIVFLGTNGWYTTETGNTTCVLIETEKSYIVLDAGNGIYKLGNYIKDGKKPVYLFLSHFHLDHISGLHILNKFKFKQGLTICCYIGGKNILNTIMNQPYTIASSKLPFKIRIKELGTGWHKNFPFKLKSKKFIHASKCFGYRFEFDNKVVSYCTDTGYCREAVELSDNADLVIAECTLRHDQKITVWPHLNPKTVARLAKEAHAKRLALIHFDADNYRTSTERKKAEFVSKKIFRNVFAANDGMVVKI